jgi:hypothetical protein
VQVLSSSQDYQHFFFIENKTFFIFQVHALGTKRCNQKIGVCTGKKRVAKKKEKS